MVKVKRQALDFHKLFTKVNILSTLALLILFVNLVLFPQFPQVELEVVLADF